MSSTFRYLANPRSPRQLHALDGLRALAILLVLFRHGFKVVDFAAVQQTSSSPLMSAYAVLARSGWMGVDLFFVLSGFLIGGQLLKFYESARPLGTLRRFYVNRFFRIIPAYFGLLVLIQFVVVRDPGFFGVIDPAHVSRYIGAHYLFLQDYIGSFMFPVFWSLGVEEKFYLVAPLLVAALYFGLKRHAARIAVLVALLVLPLLARLALSTASPELAAGQYQALRYSWFHLRLDGLIVGILTVFLYNGLRDRSGPASAAARRLLLPLGALLTLLVLLYTPHAAPWGSYSLVYSGTVIALVFGVLVLGAALTPNEKAGILGSALPYFIARISYSLYLTHDLWVFPVLRFHQRTVVPMNWSADVQLTVYFGMFLLAAVAAATLYYYVLEKPFLLLKDRFSIARLHAVEAGAQAAAVVRRALPESAPAVAERA